MLTFSYKGRAYKRMPELVITEDGDCLGCAFDNGKPTLRTKGCQAAKDAMGENNYCNTEVWVLDTPKGLAQYIALKLEHS